jgi:N-acetylglucosamine-6-phosphate deacetylase
MDFRGLFSIKRILSSIVLFLMLHLTYAQQKIEGLSYLDGKPLSVVIKNGKIAQVNRIADLPAGSRKLYIAPGMIDNQVNGFLGVSFVSEAGGNLTLEDFKKATKGLWERGVTTYFATLSSNSKEELMSIISKIGQFKNDKSLHGSVPGFHLEGPYISPEEGYRGAHTLKFIRKPDWDEFMELYRASGNSILTVTVAPETEGAMEFIKKCNEKGIVVALGHHNADAATVNRAVENGAKICTHLGNGCANSINRHLNPLWPQLSNDKLSISIICDGFHLTPEEIRVFYKVKGSDRTLVTSDVTEFAGLAPGIYKIFDGAEIELTTEGELRYPAEKVLYGAASAMDKGVRHIMNVTGCSLADAIKMASTNQAKLYGLTDRGSIETGKRADLILFELGDSRLKIFRTYVNGELVYDSGDK